MSSGSRSKSKRSIQSSSKYNNIPKNPYPLNIFASNKDGMSHKFNNESAKHYKHIKSNSEAVNKLRQDFDESKGDNSAQVYSNRHSKLHKKYSPEKAIPPISIKDDNNDQNLIIFSDCFNTVKYSQSPFLNKLTNLKQKMTKKEKIAQKYSKGHKSRNSMFPKSYTEDPNFKRREAEIYAKLGFNPGFDQIPEESTNKNLENDKNLNPYSNIVIENEVTSAYGNEQTTPNEHVIFRGLEKSNVRMGSDKKRAPTDTTRSKTGIDASNDSGKNTPQVQKNCDSTSFNQKNVRRSENKQTKNNCPKPYKSRLPSEYYQNENNCQDAARKGEIISILSMEIGESEGLSHSYSHHGERSSQYKRNSKKDLQRLLGIENFENQKTQKQNMHYLKGQITSADYETPVKPIENNLNVIHQRPLESRHCKHRKVEYRERLEEMKGHHKNAKSHRHNKHQYIRSNHDIIDRHQRHKSSDSTENSILKRSDGFEVLYQRNEKLEKKLNKYDSSAHVDTSYENGHAYSIQSVEEQDESSSISEIDNNKILKFRDPESVDMIRVADSVGRDTQKSFESVLNCFKTN